MLVYIDYLLVHTTQQAPISSGQGFGMPTQKSPEDQPREMCIWQQGGLVPGVHTNPRRNQT